MANNMAHRPSSLAIITAYAAVLLPLLLLTSSVSAFSSPQCLTSRQTRPFHPPPPPPISMPVWSLSCPIPFPTQDASSSSMSILTYVTPVSVSSPKLWAVSLYKTSLTRCSFLGVPKFNNDIPSTVASSVTTGSGSAYSPGRKRWPFRVYDSVRNRDSMGETGLSPDGVDVEGAVGWRVTGDYRSSSRLPGSKHLGSTKGVGILQLLSPNQSMLVDGGAMVKKEECAKIGHEWVGIGSDDDEERFEVLPHCASYIQINLKRVTDGGDHDVCIVQVTKTGVWDDVNETVMWLEEGDQQPALDPTTALYSGQLSKQEEEEDKEETSGEEDKGVFISDINYDGEVFIVESDEYVEITNDSKSPTDISGYSVVSLNHHGTPDETEMAKFTFPTPTELKPRQIVRVYTNEDHPESGGYSFDRGIQIWNNKGGKGVLKDRDDNEISQFVYPLQEAIVNTKQQLEEAEADRQLKNRE
mmetsp:Transcript_11156/g.22188  ORF Transcript_11156/g.22188 Transcript_11156/m.22188 type:complete len:470 (+) Transcript_11156:36-1445(+)